MKYDDVIELNEQLVEQVKQLVEQVKQLVEQLELQTIAGKTQDEKLSNLKNKEISKKEFLSPQEVSEEFGFRVITLEKWRMQKKYLNYSKVGKLVKYNRNDIVKFIEERKKDITL